MSKIRSMRLLWRLLAGLVFACLAACTPVQSPASVDEATESPYPVAVTPVTAAPPLRVVPITPTIKAIEEETMPVPTIPGPSEPSAGGLVTQAKEDLAQRLNIAIETIAVAQVDEVTWRDGSLGCPQPGMVYTQALVNGTRIELEADGQLYYYHSGGGRPPFLCENPQEPLSPGQGGLEDS